jgi:predicted subunit of tRNA(5-methylaminomethyl-2-thiouridylate) methyltransferase
MKLSRRFPKVINPLSGSCAKTARVLMSDLLRVSDQLPSRWVASAQGGSEVKSRLALSDNNPSNFFDYPLRGTSSL